MASCKRLVLGIMVLVLSLSLCGCLIIPISQHYDIPIEDVVSIQFYDLRGEDASHYHGFHNSCEPVFTLAEEDKAAFLEDFSALEFTDTILIVLAAVDPSFEYGDWVVRFNFTNGRYGFCSYAGFGETFEADGSRISSTHLSCEKEELEALIRKYYQDAFEK